MSERVLTRIDGRAIKVGDIVRVVSRHDLVTEGEVTAVRTYDSKTVTGFVINGRSYDIVSHFELYLVMGDMIPSEMPVIELSDEAVRDLVSDLQSQRRAPGAKVRAVSAKDIAAAALGFDPAVMKPAASFGGRSESAYWNEFIKYGRIRTALDRLVAEEALVKVTHAARFADIPQDERFVSIFGKTGWVTREAYDEGVALYRAEHESKQRKALRAQAIQIVADAHPDEVEAELAKLLVIAGLSPE